MDPNATLKSLELELASNTFDRLAKDDCVADLAAWLDRGGFAPDWSACPKATAFFNANR